jgi:mRNA-degrading endonuclease toxin of MazEF toxin-antitoxin module
VRAGAEEIVGIVGCTDHALAPRVADPRQLARQVHDDGRASHLPGDVSCGSLGDLYDGLATLPHFNPNDDADELPARVVDLRLAIRAADTPWEWSPPSASSVPRLRGSRGAAHLNRPRVPLPDEHNSLTAMSVAQCHHLRAVSTGRIVSPRGSVGAAMLAQIRETIAIMLDIPI